MQGLGDPLPPKLLLCVSVLLFACGGVNEVMGFLRHVIRLGLTALLRHIVLVCINPVTLPSPNRQLPLGNCNQGLPSTQLALSAAHKSQRLSWKMARGDGGTDTHGPSRGVPAMGLRVSGKEGSFGCRSKHQRHWAGVQGALRSEETFLLHQPGHWLEMPQHP